MTWALVSDAGYWKPMRSFDSARARTLRVRDGDPWPEGPVVLGQTLLCPDGALVQVEALRGLRDEHGAFVHLVTVTDAARGSTSQPPAAT